MKIAREIEWTKMENTWLRAFEITKYLKENIENVEKLEKKVLKFEKKSS